MDKLTVKQRRFCDYYIETGNGTEAAVRAGYSVNSAKEIASENLTKPNIANYIQKVSEQLQNERLATIIEVKEYWTSTMREQEGDHTYRLKASEYLARTMGAFIDKTEITGKEGGPIEISDTREKLIAELTKGK